MKRYSSIYKAAVLPLVLAVLFASCENLISPPPGAKADSAEAGKASVSITVSDTIARTVLPELNPNELTYILTGKRDVDEVTKQLAEFSGSGTTLAIDEGNWSFTLTALNKERDPVLKADTGGKLEANKSVTVTFTLRPLREGTGAVNISFTNLAGISKVIVESECDDLDYVVDPLPAGSGTWAYVKADIPWGDYFTTFTFYRGEEAAAVVSEIIQVRSGLTSKKTIGITIDDTRPAGDTLAEKLQWIADHAVSGASYLLELTEVNEAIKPTTLGYGGKTVSITLTGIGGEKTIGLSETGTMFTVKSGVTLTLENNITLSGRPDNTVSLVHINGGTLVLNNGAKISGNTGSYVGGVEMTDGSFTMNGGEISGNTAFSNGYGGGGSGGGMIIWDGTFTMNGGKISGNSSSEGNAGGGGGVEMRDGIFTMNDGEISGNIGHGVSVRGGTNTMKGGKISGNTAGIGGGVIIWDGNFTMNDGEISGNTATSSGFGGYGGVDRLGGGSGVYVGITGVFSKTGGVIYGNDGTPLANNALEGRGQAVYWDTLPLYRDLTLNANDSISTADTGHNWDFDPPAEETPLGDDWISRSIATGEEQWYTFTASDANQYIHTKGDGTWHLFIDVYDSDLQPVGGRPIVGYSNLRCFSGLSPGESYHIQVWSPDYGGYSGNYEIMISKSPIPGITVPALTDSWSQGNIPASGDQQLFEYTASTGNQYIHAKFGTLNELYVQVYDSTLQPVYGNILSGSTGDITSWSFPPFLSAGQTYYISVRPAYSGSGDYKLAVSKSPLAPGTTVPTVPALTDSWSQGKIAANGDEQWFEYTASAANQYLHVKFGTLNELYVQVYDNTGQSVTGHNLYLSGSTGATAYTYSLFLSAGQTYYINVRPISGSGDYEIAASQSPLAPGAIIPALSDNWIQGNDQQFFEYTASAGNQYLHVKFGSLNELLVEEYDSTWQSTGRILSGSTGATASMELYDWSPGQTYYISVGSYSGSGDYKIAVNDSPTPPASP